MIDPLTMRIMSGVIIFRSGGPISWASILQERTSRSSSEAEIKATSELTKRILALKNVMGDIHLHDAHKCTRDWNDNRNCVDWACGIIPKAVCHVNIRDAYVRSSVWDCEIQVKHIIGKLNPADLFTKEIRDNLHFRTLRDLVVQASS